MIKEDRYADLKSVDRLAIEDIWMEEQQETSPVKFWYKYKSTDPRLKKILKKYK